MGIKLAYGIVLKTKNSNDEHLISCSSISAIIIHLKDIIKEYIRLDHLAKQLK